MSYLTHARTHFTLRCKEIEFFPAHIVLLVYRIKIIIKTNNINLKKKEHAK